MSAARRIVLFPKASNRIAAARQWLSGQTPGAEILIIAPSWDAADDLLRPMALNSGALFAIHRLTPGRLYGLLAAPALTNAGLAPANPLISIAIAARGP